MLVKPQNVQGIILSCKTAGECLINKNLKLVASLSSLIGAKLFLNVNNFMNLILVLLYLLHPFLTQLLTPNLYKHLNQYLYDYETLRARYQLPNFKIKPSRQTPQISAIALIK